MTATALDHLVVAADTLERGIAHVETCLGVTCDQGGHHPRMGTHNALLRLGMDSYIEVIAIDPDAGLPEIPRWFGLDDPAIRALLRERPRLLTWVARTTNIAATIEHASHDSGPVRHMQRGDLEWQIAFAADGALIEDGLVPSLIEWGPDTVHPAKQLNERGIELQRLIVRHAHPERLRSRLDALGLADRVEIEPPTATQRAPALRALLDTPQGERWLT